MTKSERKRDVPAYISFCAITILCFAVLLVILVCRILVMNPDNDMWWMMATGREIVETHSLPHTNGFVLHEGLSMIVEQWPVAVLNFGVYDALGAAGLYGLAGLLVALNLFLTNRLAALLTKDRTKRVLCVIAVGMILYGFCCTRPAIFTMAVLLGECILFEKYRLQGKIRYLYGVALLSVCMSNLHMALWPMILIIAAPYAVEQYRQWRQMLLPACLTILGGAVNPYGTDGMLYLMRAYRNSSIWDMIKEIQPPAVASFEGIILVAFVVLLAFYMMREKKACRPAVVLMAAGTLLLGCMHHRNFIFVLLGAIPLICTTDWNPDSIKFRSKPCAAALTGALLILLFASVGLERELTEKENEPYLPLVEYLQSEGVSDEARIFAEFNLGGYLEWYGYKPYMDSRVELYQKAINGQKDISDEYGDLIQGKLDYREFVDGYAFDYILTEQNCKFDIWLDSTKAYHRTLSAAGYSVYQKGEE